MIFSSDFRGFCDVWTDGETGVTVERDKIFISFGSGDLYLLICVSLQVTSKLMAEPVTCVLCKI